MTGGLYRFLKHHYKQELCTLTTW